MRTKIDYGIDLGTTNSAVARMDNGKPKIIKSDTSSEITPSCININIKTDILVGDTAVGALKRDRIRALKTWNQENSNSYIEFKRTMGTDTKYFSSNMNKEFSSEELSAEVLMKLKSLITDENIKSIVITVPAKFTMVQKDSTVKAGKLAGFQQIELLQEPIAASMAYGLDSVSKDGFWLVFDFGGGTFDAAIIKIEDGIMKVIDTEGDNWLGGKNIDEAIVDQIIIPYLSNTFSIAEILSDKNKKEILRNAVKILAEECKIQMSFKESHSILTDLGDLPFEDENGEEPSLDIKVDQELMKKVLIPIFQKAIDICKDLLKRKNLKGSQLTTIILVGGPTYSPILRKMLKEQINDKVNISIDPMTCVATGAALFASTIEISSQIIEESRDKAKIQLDIKHEATTVDMVEMISIKILRTKTTGIIPNKVFVDIVRGDKAWASGKKQISEKATLVDVQLNAATSNSFQIILYDEEGDKLNCEPNTINILQGINPGQGTLPYHIGIEIFDRVLQEDVFKPCAGLEKNKEIPPNGLIGLIKALRTQKVIRPGMINDSIIIPIYQGDYSADGTRAIYNEHIFDVEITGETFPALLPVGSDVEITLKINRSEGATLSAFFPYLNYTEEIPVNFIQKKAVTPDYLRSEITKAKKQAMKVNAELIKQGLNEVDEKLNNKEGSDSGRLEVLSNLREQLRILDKISQETEFPKLEIELKERFYRLEELAAEREPNDIDQRINWERVHAGITDYKIKIEQVLLSKELYLGKELLENINSSIRSIYIISEGKQLKIRWIKEYDAEFNDIEWKDKSRARNIITRGVQIANSESTEEQLENVLDQIRNELAPSPENEARRRKLSN